MTALIEYPSAADARLPASYEAAKTALATCEQIDECAEWANKMEALASYARQSENDELLKHCLRIKARAIRRCGELLNEVEPAKPGPKINTGGGMQFGRDAAAREAGLSKRQKDTAIQVANVPRDEFERQTESDAPPTITALAEQGRAPRPAPLIDLQGRDPADFSAATQGIGTIRFFVEFTEEMDISRVLRGALPHDVDRLREYLRAIREWAEQTEEACNAVF